MPDCAHQNLVLQLELSSRTLNVYQCSTCGAQGFRRWSQSKGLSPFAPYKTPGLVEKRVAWELQLELNRVEQMRHRDQETDLLDL